jgi:hypothetical protein
VMRNRMMWAAALVICVSIAPAQSADRGGVAGGFPRTFVPARSFAPTHIAVPPAATQGHVAMPPHAAVPANAGLRNLFSARAAFARRHREHLFGGLPHAAAVLGALYGSYYDPSDYAYYDPSDVGSLPPTVYPVPDAAPYAPPVEHYGCQSQTVTVPSSGGGEADVIITRC